ncbi:MAG: hypothetical protein RLZ12_348 [Bacillota bacterium]|jgi:hypothetical protein
MKKHWVLIVVAAGLWGIETNAAEHQPTRRSSGATQIIRASSRNRKSSSKTPDQELQVTQAAEIVSDDNASQDGNVTALELSAPNALPIPEQSFEPLSLTPSLPNDVTVNIGHQPCHETVEASQRRSEASAGGELTSPVVSEEVSQGQVVKPFVTVAEVHPPTLAYFDLNNAEALRGMSDPDLQRLLGRLRLKKCSIYCLDDNGVRCSGGRLFNNETSNGVIGLMLSLARNVQNNDLLTRIWVNAPQAVRTGFKNSRMLTTKLLIHLINSSLMVGNGWTREEYSLFQNNVNLVYEYMNMRGSAPHNVRDGLRQLITLYNPRFDQEQTGLILGYFFAGASKMFAKSFDNRDRILLKIGIATNFLPAVLNICQLIQIYYPSTTEQILAVSLPVLASCFIALTPCSIFCTSLFHDHLHVVRRIMGEMQADILARISLEPEHEPTLQKIMHRMNVTMNLAGCRI